MLDVLQIEDVRVRLSICTYNDDEKPGFIGGNAGSFFPPLNEFVYLRAEVANLSGRWICHFRVNQASHCCAFPAKQVTLVLDVTISPSDHVLYERVLSGIPVGHVNGGESYKLDIPLTFIACGRFEVIATARIPDQTSSAGHGHITAFVK